MIDSLRYCRLRPLGVTRVVLTENGLVLEFDRYNPESGQRLMLAEQQPFSEDEILERKQLILDELKALDLVLNEVRALAEVRAIEDGNVHI